MNPQPEPVQQRAQVSDPVLPERERETSPPASSQVLAASETAARSRRSRPVQVKVRRKHYDLIKRLLDLAITVALTPLAVPVMGLCMLAIWFEDGRPVLFLQERTGKGGKPFLMYKFRTMVTNAEELKTTYAHLNQLQWPDFKIANDPRITRVGRILRKTSLDELPQLLNVLRGDMSLVGPRPTSFAVATYKLLQTERLEVVPGITGLWQISGRGDIDFDERLRMDVQYIEQRSIGLDLWILCKTVVVVLRRRGAY